MASVHDLARADRVLRDSAASLGDALAAVPVYAEPALARAVQAEQNLYARIDAEFGLLTAAEAGRRLGSRSSAPRNLTSAHRLAGRLVALQRGHQAWYPGFQFGPDGQALPVIADLRRLAHERDRSETGLVQWLCSPTTYLDDDARPVDLLATAPDVVLAVAEQAWGVDW